MTYLYLTFKIVFHHTRQISRTTYTSYLHQSPQQLSGVTYELAYHNEPESDPHHQPCIDESDYHIATTLYLT